MTAVPDSESDRLWVALYSMAAVIVVFCVIIVTLGVTTVIIYRKKSDHTRSKSKTAGKSIFAISHSL